MRAAPRLGLGLVALAGACNPEPDDMTDIFTRGVEHRIVCGLSIDTKNHVTDQSIDDGLDQAVGERATMQLYAHSPPGTITVPMVDSVLSDAAERGMAFVTYDQLAAGDMTPGLALSFDDHDIAGWYALRPVFDRYHAKVTFFISGFHALTPDERGWLHELAGDGHAIAYHTTNHLHAPAYVSEHGIDAYLADEIAPDLALMRADGYAPTAFAYPFGARTDDLDAELLERFALVRAIHSTCPY